MNRLWVKLSLAFLAISLAAIGVVAVLAGRATGEQFRQYVVASGMASQPAWAEALTGYYADRGSWDGVGDLLAQLGPGAGMGRGRGTTGFSGPNIAIAGPDGRVVASKTGELVGEALPAAVLAQGTPLIVQGQTVGIMLNVRPGEVALDAPAQIFLQQVRRSLLWAGLLAAGLSLLLGVLVSRLLTAPLARLTSAAQAIAQGDLSQRVQVRSQDEIGELAGAFNSMSSALAEAETLRQNLLADISHELRTPLTVIQGNLQAILDGVYPLEMAQVVSLHDETILLTRLVNDLHDLALADAGQLRLECTAINLLDLARATLDQFTPIAEASGVSLQLSAAGGAPLVNGDPDRLAQVLRNLLGNALRHTPAGGRIVLQIGTTAGMVQVAVSDTGAGISPEDLPHVFDRFYRGDKSRSRRGGGAGLGLAIARQLVTAHQGHIDVSSTAGAGAIFTITLPLASPS